MAAAARRTLAVRRPRLTACVHEHEPAIALLRDFSLQDLDRDYIGAEMLMPRDDRPGKPDDILARRRNSPWRPLAAKVQSPPGHPLRESVHGVRAIHGIPALDGVGCAIGQAQILVDFEVGNDTSKGFRFADRTGETDPDKIRTLAASGKAAVESLEEHYEGIPGDVLVNPQVPVARHRLARLRLPEGGTARGFAGVGGSGDEGGSCVAGRGCAASHPPNHAPGCPP